MTEQHRGPTTLIVEIDAGGDPVEGRIGPSPRELRRFRGWSELAAAIERYRPEPADRVPNAGPRADEARDA